MHCRLNQIIIYCKFKPEITVKNDYSFICYFFAQNSVWLVINSSVFNMVTDSIMTTLSILENSQKSNWVNSENPILPEFIVIMVTKSLSCNPLHLGIQLQCKFEFVLSYIIITLCLMQKSRGGLPICFKVVN